MAASSPVSAPTGLVPVASQERVPILDVLRGFCLFGVLWSNLNDWYSATKAQTPFDHALQWTQNWLLEERFYSMLGFLFGIGFAIQLTRAAQRGQDARNLFLRRMAVLLAFGLIHGMLIWHGDILTRYALIGFALVLFRNWSPRKLLLAVPVLWLLYPYAVTHLAAVLNISLPNYGPAWREVYMRTLQVHMHGTWVQSVAQGIIQFLGSLSRSLLLGGSASFLALFILGLWAVRVDLIDRLTRCRSTILLTLAMAAVCWAGCQYIANQMFHWWPRPNLRPNWHELLFWWPPMGIVSNFFSHAATWATSAVYALVFVLANSYRGAAKGLQPLAALGRMTLTTYITQSLVSTFVFYNWGLGLINKVNFTGIFVFTLGLFSLQMAFSSWWLRRYQYGPAEWVWRSLAYGRRLPLRIGLSPPVAARTEISTV
jgi:uncharacterized protein